MSLTPYEVAILRAVLDGCDTVEAVAYVTRLSSVTVRHRVRSLVGQGVLIRHPRIGALSLTIGGREALGRAQIGGAA